MNDDLKDAILSAMQSVGIVKQPEPTAQNKDYSINGRAISNGYIISESCVEETGEGDNCCRDWKNKETYYPSAPSA